MLHMGVVAKELSPAFFDAWLDELRFGCGSRLRGPEEDLFFWVFIAGGRGYV